MSLQKEAEMRFCGSEGGFALPDLPVEEQLGIVTPLVPLWELGAGHRAGRHGQGRTAEDGQREAEDTLMARSGFQSWGCHLVPC